MTASRAEFDQCIDYAGLHVLTVFRVKLTFPKDTFEKHIDSVLPDLEDNVGRSTTRIEEDVGNFYIYIEAPDTVSLRASVGSLTRWLSIVDRIFEEVK